MRWVVSRSRLEGQVRVPGDKSIGHRALMLSALAPGRSVLHGMPDGEDVHSTASCLNELGAVMFPIDGGLAVQGCERLHAAARVLNAGNSGTTMRLLAGILAGQPFDSVLDGDASLRARPMRRVIEPLRMMGAEICAERGQPPLHITGSTLRGIEYQLPIASAQVKSAVLLAGLFAEGVTSVVETSPTRDHTERLLSAVGVDIKRSASSISVQGGQRPVAFTAHIPGDISSAAFLLAGAVITDGDVTVERVGINPTRTGFLKVLVQMGATVEIGPAVDEHGEPAANVRATGSVSRPIALTEAEVPSLVDELPLVALLMTQAQGESTLRGAAELRVKESDRIMATCLALRALGAHIDVHSDGWTVHGPTPLRGGIVDSFGDHRIALLGASAGLAADSETIVTSAQSAAVSFPGFERTLKSLGGRIDVG